MTKRKLPIVLPVIFLALSMAACLLLAFHARHTNHAQQALENAFFDCQADAENGILSFQSITPDQEKQISDTCAEQTGWSQKSAH